MSSDSAITRRVHSGVRESPAPSGRGSSPTPALATIITYLITCTTGSRHDQGSSASRRSIGPSAPAETRAALASFARGALDRDRFEFVPHW
jgi:hypothetical protein